MISAFCFLILVFISSFSIICSLRSYGAVLDVAHTHTHKTNRETLGLNYTSDQINLKRHLWTISTKNCRNEILLSKCETFYILDHMLGHKTSLNRVKENETTAYIFSNHNEIKLQTNKNFRNYRNTWKLNNIPLTKQWVRKEIKRKI